MSKVTELEDITEADRVVGFKMQWLIHAGYSPDNAEMLAKTEGVDWHLAVDIYPLAKAKGVDEQVIVDMFT